MKLAYYDRISTSSNFSRSFQQSPRPSLASVAEQTTFLAAISKLVRETANNNNIDIIRHAASSSSISSSPRDRNLIQNDQVPGPSSSSSSTSAGNNNNNLNRKRHSSDTYVKKRNGFVRPLVFSKDDLSCLITNKKCKQKIIVIIFVLLNSRFLIIVFCFR